jgi:hypothetical protein
MINAFRLALRARVRLIALALVLSGAVAGATLAGPPAHADWCYSNCGGPPTPTSTPLAHR